jgi:HD-GYP domain-containing protein (c-di-GMP phosphodiesterase class II)
VVTLPSGLSKDTTLLQQPDARSAIVEAIKRTQDDLARGSVLAEHHAQLFAASLLTRLASEQRDRDSFALDLWVAELAALEPLTDYARVITIIWAALLRHARSAPIAQLAGLLERRDRLQATIESVSPRSPAAPSEARVAAVQALQSMLGNYMPFQTEHVEAVGRTCVALANELGLTADLTEILWASGVVHDIGMVMVPRRTIEKHGKLSAEELDRIRRHVDYSITILRSVRSLRDCVPIVAAHHERFDGGGYPVGHAGERIAYGARILAVADAVEAMLAPRPYRLPRPASDVKEILAADQGAQWDPEIAQVAIELIESGEIHALEHKERIA